MVKALFGREPFSSLHERMLRLGMRLNPSMNEVFDNSSFTEAKLDISVGDPLYASELNEIPSYTFESERKFLYSFFKNWWAGQTNVLEIGPYLGGSTRAIAMGMYQNPRRRDASKLFTYDRCFGSGVSPQSLSELQTLVLSGAISEASWQAIQSSTSFSEVFRILHQDKPYYPLIIPIHSVLPNSKDEASKMENVFHLDPHMEFDAVFIDGCKSWYSTKHFMQEVGRCTRPGTWFIFQDYGWYQCFWIPVFLEVMGVHFTLFAYVHNTYMFQLRGVLDADEADQRYPDVPDELGRTFFDEVFNELLSKAKYRRDHHALVGHGLQHAAALAYIGELEEAKAKIVELANQPRLSNYHRSIIGSALRSPTYFTRGENVQPVYL